MRFRQPRRHPQQHRLAEPAERPAALLEPAHDRRRRQAPIASRARSTSASADTRLRRHTRHRRQRRHGLMLEHHARRDRQTRPPRPAHQLDRHDAVAAQARRSCPRRRPAASPSNLGKQPAQQLLLRVARRTLRMRPATSSGAGSARRSSLPFGVSGRRSSTTIADGTMCSGSTCASEARSACRLRHRRPRRRHHIADQPRGRPRHPRAPPPPPATHPLAAAAPPRSRQARSGTRAASPARPHAPKTPAHRPTRHRARSPVRYIREPARRQRQPAAPCGSATNRSAVRPRTMQIAPRKPNARDVQLANNARQEQAQDKRPERKLDNSAERTTNRDVQPLSSPPRACRHGRIRP